ncbi:hypothetical protein ADUPG1_000485 [Aduncisulcus paluster]|uniref:EF-hand domain-containing protein n=1 Tax=Aduncisulcus paluster TaxID=2918883 RepID=A0ABQ5K6Z4_9EUKA|nr:hypothetical protein ADUPG1_000485 [Aduncisulcus paluster]
MSYSQPKYPAHRRTVRHEVTEEQKQEVREAFDLFDTNKSGTIDFHEFRVAMRALGFDVTKEQATTLMSEYDRDRTGELTVEDFLSIMEEKIATRDPEEEMARAFALFDDDQTGKISIKNLKRVAKELGEPLTEDEMRAMIEEYDKDGDGEISKEEFLAILRSSSF